jgi:hypothetical protein
MTRLWPQGEPVRTWGGEERPAGFAWDGASHRIVETCNLWRVHSRWWEPGEAVWREYVKVATDTGLLCLLYQDLLAGGWFLARVYD